MPRLVAIAGPGRAGRLGCGAALRLRALDDRLAGHRRRSGDRALRQRRPELAPRRAHDRRSRGGQARPLREAARARRRGELRHLAAGGGDRRQAPLRVQLPLRSGGAARARDDRGRRARRDQALPRALPAGLGRRPDARHVALRRRRGRARGRSATSALTWSTSRASSSARSPPCRRSSAPSSRDGRSTTRSRRPSSSRAAPSGTIEATRFALGRRNAFQWEINGSKGSLAFDMERLNELQVFRADGDRANGFTTVLVSEADHPFWELLVAARAHHRLGRDVRPRDPPPAAGDRGGHGRRPVRRHVRGRLPRGRGVRRDRPLGRERAARDDQLPLSRGPVYRADRDRPPGSPSARSAPAAAARSCRA